MSSVSTAAPAPRNSAILDILTRNGPTGLVLWTIAVVGVAHLIMAAWLGYGYGEGYYLATARHLALSYFDQPPVSLWTAWAAIQVGGMGATVVTRLPFILMFSLTTWLMYRLGARLFGAWAGAWSAVILNLSLVFAVSVGAWVQPDAPLFLFLVAAAIPVVDLAFGKPSRPLLTWAAAGACFGLALLSKYPAALTLGGLLLFVATTPGYRAWFFKPGLLLAAIIAALIFLPVVVWNWQNDWASFAFQGGRAGMTELRFDWLFRSIVGQGLLIGILLWPPLIWVSVKAARSGPRDPKVWFLCCLAIIPIILFTIVALWAPLGYHFHWQAPGYVFLFPLLGKAVADSIERGERRTRLWLGIQAGLLLFIALVLAAQARFGWVHAILPQSFKAEPYDKYNPTRELLTWNGLRDGLLKAGLLPAKRTFAVVGPWTLTGKVDEQIGDDVPVVVFSGDPRNIAYGWHEGDFVGWDALIVTTSAQPMDVKAEYGAYFRSFGDRVAVDVYLGSEVALTVFVTPAKDYYRRYPMPVGPK